MAGRYGTVIATLAEAAEQDRLDEFAALINTRIKPLEPVRSDDIYVRGMYIVSDDVNSFGGRFPVDEFPTLQEKLINTPVLVGHRKDSLPIGRTFHAMQIERNGRMWVKSLFYWLKSADGAQMLADNIDGGIYQECSIGFIYRLPECSVCGNDIRQCEHQVFSVYSSGASPAACHFVYREIEKVLETSLVYRGANPDTGMSRELAEGDGVAVADMATATLRNAGDDERIIVIPRYTCVPVKLAYQQGKLCVTRIDGKAIQRDLSKLFDVSAPKDFGMCYGQLIGYRGKERCSQTALERYLANTASHVTRIEVKLLPDANGVSPKIAVENAHASVRPIRYRIAAKEELTGISEALRTKDGVRVWRMCDYDPAQSVSDKNFLNTAAAGCKLAVDASQSTAVLSLAGKTYRLNHFDMRLWGMGRSFLADVITNMTELEMPSGTHSAAAVVIRPVQLGGRQRFMISCKNGNRVKR